MKLGPPLGQLVGERVSIPVDLGEHLSVRQLRPADVGECRVRRHPHQLNILLGEINVVARGEN